jgi:argininosuccinate synthase
MALPGHTLRTALGLTHSFGSAGAIAQPDETDFGEIETRMRACGAADYVAIPLHNMIAESGLEVIQFQARYEGAYWNTTGIGRHVIVAGMIPEMKKRGI